MTIFHDELEEHAGYLAAYNQYLLSNSLPEFISDNIRPISAKTYGRFMSGIHISPTSFKTIRQGLAFNSIERAELTIRYCEAFLGSYTYISTVGQRKRFHPDATRSQFNDLLNFLPTAWNQGHAESAPHWKLSEYLGAKVELKRTAAEKDPSIRGPKMVSTTIGRRTSYAAQAGARIRPMKFHALCNNIGLNEIETAHARALFSEKLVDENILQIVPAEAQQSFAKKNDLNNRGFSPVQHPRLYDWMITRYLIHAKVLEP